MRKMLLSAVASATLLSGCASYGDGMGYRGDRYSNGGYRQNGGYGQNGSYGQYDYNNPDPSYGGYYADRYYRDDPRYRERVLGSNDRVYRGQNGQYYCRRSDGTTGLIVGGVAGGILGSIIAPGGSGVLGTILGGVAGAAAGGAIDRNQPVRCR